MDFFTWSQPNKNHVNNSLFIFGSIWNTKRRHTQTQTQKRIYRPYTPYTGSIPRSHTHPHRLSTLGQQWHEGWIGDRQSLRNSKIMLCNIFHANRTVRYWLRAFVSLLYVSFTALSYHFLLGRSFLFIRQMFGTGWKWTNVFSEEKLGLKWPDRDLTNVALSILGKLDQWSPKKIW